jgi:hypothetical protein
MGNSLAIASQKLIRGLSTKWIGDPYIAEAAVLVPSQFRDNTGGPNWFFGPNGIDYRFIFDGATSATKAFNTCPPLAAIIGRKAQAYINGKTLLLNTKGKDATGDQANRIRKLLRTPNLTQSWQDFEAQLEIFILLFGWCPIMPIYPAGFEAVFGNDLSYASSIHIIPPYMITAVENKKKMWYDAQKPSDIVTTLVIHYMDMHQEVDINKLFIFKDFTPSFSSQYFPGSRIRPLAMPINNIASAYEARNELINYAGAQGLLTPTVDSMGPIPLREAEKDQLQSDFKRQYGNKRGQWRHIISPAPMDWKAMGKPTKDLMLFEEVVDDIMRICDAYNYPSPLLNTEKGPNVSSADSFKKQVYEDGTIPESIAIYDQWNKFFKLDDSPMSLSKSYDHLPILQQDQVLMGQARLNMNQALEIEWENNLITLNYWRMQNGIDPTEDGDIYYYQTQGHASLLDQAPALPTGNQPKFEPAEAPATETEPQT